MLQQELANLGAQQLEVGHRLVTCHGDRKLLYQATLSCRTAIRVLLPIHRFSAKNEKQLYAGIRDVDWQRYLRAGGSLAIDPIVRNSFCTHSLFAAQLVKDAIVDQIREKTGQRPSVDLKNPDLRIGLYLNENQATIYLDASGDSLHKRGYRKHTGKAPLNEVLAAGIVLLTEWDRQSPFCDPMCGSGTLPIEAALLAKNCIPGLLGRNYGFENWPDYDRSLHEELLQDARNQIVRKVPPIFGSDQDPSAIKAAVTNAHAANVADVIRWETVPFEQAPVPEQPGTIVFNPPYDERLSLHDSLIFYQKIGDGLKQRYGGHRAFIFTGNLDAAKHIGLKPSRKIQLYNGALECRLLRFDIFASTGTAPSWRTSNSSVSIPPAWRMQIEMFENRLRKMFKHWGKWARRQNITCYRIYDRDIPDVPLTIDWYEGSVYCAEFERPHDRSAKEHRLWLEVVTRRASEILDVPFDRVFLKQRQRQKGTSQYTRLAEQCQFQTVQEAGHRFLVNLSDYLDTGLFLDHRKTRAMVQQQAMGKRFLNLFCYTGAFTVYAAAGQATSTTSVDTSKTYLDWAQRNLKENGLTGRRHQFVRQDVLEFLRSRQSVPMFDLVVVDPPTFSNSRAEQRVFDVQRDHVQLLSLVLSVMAPQGTVYFSTNRRKFRFEFEDPKAEIREITTQTVPPDFQRKRPHRCWLIRKNG